MPESTPLTPAVGAELTGISVGAMNDEEFAFFKDALNRYSVVLVRGQNIAPAALVDFAKRLGPLRGKSLLNKYALPGYPDISVISNIEEDGRPIGISDAGLIWHTDLSYAKAPDMYSMLFSIEIPHRDGKALGNTKWTSTAAAYDGLSPAMKEKVAPLKAVHSYAYHIEKKRREGTLTRAPLTAQELAELPDVEHPLVRTHPITGRKCLYASEGHTARLAGLPPEEADALLQELFAHIERPEFVYTHSWRPGDFIVWDNCATQHLAIKDYGTIPRRLHQLGIAGTVPF